ncbi:type I-B CRISPR-associated protein Cas8b1/Cst1 [Nitratiruptor tergarcus]|uniref:CRISPR-associated protein Cst1 n=1 Tax=Nitratiruptor tergarcus DSM 16512 TaxID=1069081 RepID=A0A1W1WRC8_9BACT|nr:type I-B CRISPR-associated protein Cas8b1/Cst1 [Nitratiruptor tergarcus]SMC08868.1 CRISPR-associated protein Cst1 [Nitratiruptor tergarcus DSM 16512]
MMLKVYLGDWLYNASILGFLNINSYLWELKTIGDKKELISQDENLLKFGDNYIEFDRKIFEGFSERFFDYAFNQYGRYENLIKLFEEYREDLYSLKSSGNLDYLNKKYFHGKEQNDKIPQKLPIEIFDRFKKILQGFKLLKDKLGKIPSKNEIKKDVNLLINLLQNAIEIMKKDKEEFWESDVQIYLRNIYGQKSFLNLSVNKNRFEKFYKDFEEPLKEDKVKKDKKLLCISCMEKKAKKNTIFDTGISKFYGLNKDSINFVWNFNPKLPLCEICEIIYFSYFAGLIPLQKDGKKVFYFVNSDSSIVDLVSKNNLLKSVLNPDLTQNILLDFFTQLILETSYEKAFFTLQNIAVLELDLNNETMPKVYSFNLSREKAKFLKESQTKENLKEFSKNYYKIKDTKISILPEIISLILENKLYFNYLNKLLKMYIAYQNGSKNYETNINPYKVQTLNLLVSKFIKDVGGKTMNMSENEMWRVYYEGKELANILRDKKVENKIQSISYKLLNSLRIGNSSQFMDILLRTYMAYREEIPSSFIKVLQNKEDFYSIGYSFLNGFLGNEKEEVKK